MAGRAGIASLDALFKAVRVFKDVHGNSVASSTPLPGDSHFEQGAC